MIGGRVSSVAGLLAAALLATAAGKASAAPPPDLDAYVGRAMHAFEAPGMAVAVVEDGKPVVAKGYGVRKLGEPAPVGAHTLFPIGSDTKAFTSAALAILVDDGKLKWDDKVVSHLPGFQMYDAYVTGEMTVTDLLTHRSGLGLGEGDLMFVPATTITPQEVVERLRYLKPARSFRGGYAYDNVLYIAAGQLVQAVSGEPWTAFIRHRIFAPLGMSDSVSSFTSIGVGADRAWPHGRFDGPLRGTGHITPYPAVERMDNADSAGGINLSATDFAKWIAVQLGHGALPDGKRLFSEAQSTAMWTPETLIPTQPAKGPLAAAQPQFQSYALGWDVQDYRGHKIITHGGAVLGSLSMVVLIPDLNVGFAVMTNSEEGGAIRAVQLKLLDHYLNQPPIDWIAAAVAARQAAVAGALQAIKAQPGGQAEGPPPSHPLSAYAGNYHDPWYGLATIASTPQGLELSFSRTPGMVGRLEHVRYDTFRTHWRDRAIEDAYVTFSLKPDGSIDQFTMKAVSPLADFSFDYQDLLFKPDRPG